MLSQMQENAFLVCLSEETNITCSFSQYQYVVWVPVTAEEYQQALGFSLKLPCPSLYCILLVFFIVLGKLLLESSKETLSSAPILYYS